MITTLSANVNRYIRFATSAITLDNVRFWARPHTTWVKIFAKNIVINWFILVHLHAAYVPINLHTILGQAATLLLACTLWTIVA